MAIVRRTAPRPAAAKPSSAAPSFSVPLNRIVRKAAPPVLTKSIAPDAPLPIEVTPAPAKKPPPGTAGRYTGGSARGTATQLRGSMDMRTNTGAVDVAKVQSALKDMGIDPGQSGVMDASTREAIKAYQQSRGMKATGVLSPITSKALAADKKAAAAAAGPSAAPAAPAPAAMPSLTEDQAMAPSEGGGSNGGGSGGGGGGGDSGPAPREEQDERETEGDPEQAQQQARMQAQREPDGPQEHEEHADEDGGNEDDEYHEESAQEPQGGDESHPMYIETDGYEDESEMDEVEMEDAMNGDEELAGSAGSSLYYAPRALRSAPRAPQRSGRPYDGFGAEGNPISCTVENGKLHCVALQPTAWGAVPLTAKFAVPGHPTGPVDAGDPRMAPVIAAARRKLLTQAEVQRQRLASESLVERSRLGDQNATAIIAEIAKSAASSPRARSAYQAVRDYIQTHPAPQDSMGVDTTAVVAPSRIPMNPTRAVNRTAVRLANNVPMTPVQVEGLVDTFCGDNSRKRQLLKAGMMEYRDPSSDARAEQLGPLERTVYNLGRSMGKAQALQRVRSDAPISLISPQAGWELGE